MNTFMRRSLVGAVMATLSASPALAMGGKWVSGDFHQHSYVTDGSFPMATVLQNGFTFGLDWQANSEHGGTSDEAGDDPRQTWNLRLRSDQFLGDTIYPKLWRWQTLADEDKVPLYLNNVRTNNPEKIVINGMELNMPGAEHCSTAIVDPTGFDIAQFEYLWDAGDKDSSGGYDFEIQPNGVEKNFINDLTKAAQAAAWMQEHFAGRGWMVPAHPERAADKDWSDGNPAGYGPNFFRTLNDVGPDVFFAFESAPGHQKSSGRGGYAEGKAYGDGTYGGVGYFAATVGGLWDALLGEGREFWLVANSDFHSTGGDFWPGEYQKTYSYMKDANHNGEYDGEDVAASLRSGNMFIVHGDLISELDFRVFQGAARPEHGKDSKEKHGKDKEESQGTHHETDYGKNDQNHGKNGATMGETLRIKRGSDITVRIRFKSPESNACEAGVNASADFVCTPPSVQHVQLIAGEVHDRLIPGSNEYTTEGTNPTTAVVATYDPGNWKVTRDGYTECSFKVEKVKKDMYFRVRGNNLPAGTALETDALGNPLFDNLVHEGLGIDGADEAWSDLWFYSNPIFIDVR